MSTMNGSVYRKTESRSVYSESLYPERTNGYSTPRPSTTYLDVPRAASRARSTNSTASHLEVPPRAPSRSHSPKIPASTEVAAVDPTLEDAQKAGNNYHITMSLNAALADAGYPASVAMSSGRASQMEYATNSRANQMEYAANSRNQAVDYGSTGARSVSRIDVYADDAPIPAPRMHLEQGTRPGSVSVIQVDRSGTLDRSASPYVISSTSSQRDMVTTNDGYTIRSVQPSAVRREVQTTVERTSGSNTVGFDLELIGGQTTTIKKTIDTGSSSGIANLPKATQGTREGSMETTYTRHRNLQGGPDDRDRHTSNTLKTRKTIPADRGKDSPDLGTMIDEEDLNSVGFTRSNPNQRPNAGMVGMGARKGYDPSNGRPGAGMFGKGARSNDHNSADTVSQRQTTTTTQERRNPWLLQGGDDDDDLTDESWAIYRQLVKGAGPGTVQQRVTVEQDEDDVMEDGPQIKDMLNVDTVSEKVLVFVGNNIAEMTIKVRTERIVPIKGSSNMFRKSAVTVNRIIEVDMMATYERQRIYENVIEKQRTSGRDLNQKETFDLYKAFLRLAEEDEGHAARDQVRIDKTTDEAQLEELKRASDYFEGQNSFQTSSSNQQQSRGGGGGGFSSTSRSNSRFRESRFHDYGNDDSELSSAIY